MRDASSMSIGGGVSPFAALQRATLFEGLEQSDLMNVALLMRPRSFDTGEDLCRVGHRGESLFVIIDGLAHVLDPGTESEVPRVIAKQRRGDVVAAMSLVTGEPHSATVVAGMPTQTLELGRAEFGRLIEKFPMLLFNLSRILSGRLARSTVRDRRDVERGEAIALIVGPSLFPALEDVLAATRRASARPVESLDTRTGFEGVVDQLDDILARNAMVVVVGRAEGRTAPLLLQYVDRAVILVEEEREAQRFATPPKESSRGARPLGLGRERVEVVLVRTQGGSSTSRTVGDLPVVRTLSRSTGDGGDPIDATDVAWLGRHLSRTKIGLALGAGGAKGYAHVGVLQVLEEAGYTVDFVAGSSIGAIIGCYLALGMSAEEIDRTLRAAFEPETVAEVFKLSMAGTSTGRETMARIFKETTQERSFDQTQIPLTVMSVDLAERAPAPIQEGPLWKALLAATALAGMFPPYEREGQRLVDGLALVPVPTGSVRDCGADLAVSVNLVSRELLSAWPGEEPPPAPPPRRRGSRMLDTLLEVMDVMQLDTSVRHAELADVVVSPRFGPGSWRDFHLADMFLRAGRQAMEEQLPELGSLARPQSVNVPK